MRSEKTFIMAADKKPSIRRGEIAFIFAIVLGLLLGVLIKRVSLGLLLGAGLGLVIVFLGVLRSRK